MTGTNVRCHATSAQTFTLVPAVLLAGTKCFSFFCFLFVFIQIDVRICVVLGPYYSGVSRKSFTSASCSSWPRASAHDAGMAVFARQAPQLVQAAVARPAAAARPGRRQARAPMAVAACLALLAPPSWFELAPSRDTPWKHTIQMSSKRQTFKQKILPEYSTDSNKIWTIDARSQDLIDPGKRS